MKIDKELYDIGTTVYVVDSTPRYAEDPVIFDIVFVGNVDEIRITEQGIFYGINNYTHHYFYKDFVYDNKQDALDACKYFNEHVKVSQTLPAEDIKNTVFWRI